MKLRVEDSKYAEISDAMRQAAKDTGIGAITEDMLWCCLILPCHATDGSVLC